ncbi:MAG: hypothetical protein JW829_02610, partial [Pirellulales bacterium]|nr:hypothetical protein [Pirellulales bacterium]
VIAARALGISFGDYPADHSPFIESRKPEDAIAVQSEAAISDQSEDELWEQTENAMGARSDPCTGVVPTLDIVDQTETQSEWILDEALVF